MLRRENKDMKFSNFLKTKQAADFLGINVRTLELWSKTGRIAYIKCPLSGYRMYSKELLQNILDRLDEGEKTYKVLKKYKSKKKNE